MRALRLLVALVVLPAPAAGEPYAARIGPATPASARVGGTDAIAGAGDWALGNGVICAAISDVDHQAGMSAEGGALVDLGHCGRDDDQLAVASPMLNLGRESALGADAIRVATGPDRAEVIVAVERGGIAVERAFALRPGTSALEVTTRARRVAPGPRFWALGEMVLNPSGSMALFAGGLRWPDQRRGFSLGGDVASLREAASAFRAADLHVLVSDPAIEPGIAYGWHLRGARLEHPDGSTRPLPFLATTGEGHTLMAVLARPFWIGSGASIGWLQLLQMGLMRLREGDVLVMEHEVIVGARGDVASITDRLHARAPRVRGHVDDPRARIHVDDGAGHPFTQVRPEASGAFAFRAPTGRYRLRARAPAGRALERSIEVGARDLELGRLAVGAPARVRLPRGATMRLVFRGIDGTPDPRFREDLLERRFGDRPGIPALQSDDVSLAGLPGDPREVTLAPGTYRVYATRGPEFDVSQAGVTAVAGEVRELEIAAPARAIDTPGWIGADLHVHSSISFDSSIPVDARLRGFAAQGGELIVTSEHNRVFDPAAAIAALGLEATLRGIPGVEITSLGRSPQAPRSSGHANAFPLAPEPGAFREGAPRFNGVRLRDIISEVRGRDARAVIQLNHPRSASGRDTDGSFLEHLSTGAAFDPAAPLDAPAQLSLIERGGGPGGTRDLDFDALELLNGPSTQRYRRTRADWLSLWLQGETPTATANSDSHRQGEIVALPRNWIRVDDDRPASVDAQALVAALREGAAIGSTGPFIDVQLDGVGPGGLVRAATPVLRVEVRAAAWVPVSNLRVWRDATPLLDRPVAAGERVEIPLQLDADAFIWVEVSGEADETYAAIAPGFTPQAFCNPIRVDVDGDGVWTPPGLPEPAPPALADPLRPLRDPR